MPDWASYLIVLTVSASLTAAILVHDLKGMGGSLHPCRNSGAASAQNLLVTADIIYLQKPFRLHEVCKLIDDHLGV